LKSTKDATKFYEAKVKELETNLRDLEKIVQGKSDNLRIVEDGKLSTAHGERESFANLITFVKCYDRKSLAQIESIHQFRPASVRKTYGRKCSARDECNALILLGFSQEVHEQLGRLEKFWDSIFLLAEETLELWIPVTTSCLIESLSRLPVPRSIMQ
jgi:hypothetical protein